MEEEIIALLPTLIGLAGPVLNAIETGVSTNNIGSIITNSSILKLFTTLGSQLFPKAAPQIQLAGSIIATYSPNYVKWLQGLLNLYLKPTTTLAVDGSYGPKTIAAVEAAQTKLGLTVDGVAGDLTMAALNYFLNPPAQKTAA